MLKIAVRSHDQSRTAWTLFPIAVRLAIALREYPYLAIDGAVAPPAPPDALAGT